MACAVVLLQPSSAAAQPAIADADFVTVDGTRFVVGGAPFHVVGANAAVMHGRAHRGALIETLDAVVFDGLNVIRVWALGEYPSDASPSVEPYAFRIGEDGWVASSFAHLDRVLAEARARDLRVIVVLANRWGDYGGATQYVRWSGIPYESATIERSAMGAFYESVRAEQLYRAHVERVVSRHRDNPTVLAWELMNEMEAVGSVTADAMVGWVERQSAFVHSIDPNHLVSAGHIGYSGSVERRVWRRVCEVATVDYCDSHAYPVRNGGVRRRAALQRWIDDRVQLAHYVVGKPLLFGEVGFRTDRRALEGTPRDRWFGRFLARTLIDGAAGALAWTYLPSDGHRRRFGIYTEGRRVRQTRDVRRVLAAYARRARRRVPENRNRSLGPERGARALYQTSQSWRREQVPHRGWVGESERRLRVDPRAFDDAQFETLGVYETGLGIPHFYGAGVGRIRFRFSVDRETSELALRVHASSEVPGAGNAGPADTSNIVVAIDGVDVARFVAPIDDGVGAIVDVSLELDAPLAPGTHRIVFTASEGGASGLCLYAHDLEGTATGVELIAP